MKSYKKILAGINFSHLDEQVVNYASLLNLISQPEELIFYHAVENKNISGTEKTAIENKVRKVIDTHFNQGLGNNIKFLIESGDPQNLILQKSKDKALDLLILGRKTSERNKTLTGNLINNSGSSLCLIPDHAVAKINNIVVGVDFSDASHNGLNAAVEVAKATGAEIHCLNIYTVPSGYHTSGKDYDEYAAIMKNNAKKAAEKFQKKYHFDIPLNFDFVLDDDTHPADNMHNYAQKIKADLICIGSRGMDPFASVFFDSTAESIVELSNNIAMLIIKDKNKNRNLLDAIREL